MGVIWVPRPTYYLNQGHNMKQPRLFHFIIKFNRNKRTTTEGEFSQTRKMGKNVTQEGKPLYFSPMS